MTTPAGLAVLVLSATMPGVPAYSQEPLPAIELRLQCIDQGAEAMAEEIGSIMALHDFAETHDAQVVWLDVSITADNGAGECSRTSADQLEAEITGPRIHIESCGAEDARAGCEDDGMVRVRAFGPPLVLSRSIHLPDRSALSETLPYRMDSYGDWLNYQGPFIVRYHEGTGYAYVTFHQPDPALPGVWERAACNARPSACKD